MPRKSQEQLDEEEADREGAERAEASIDAYQDSINYLRSELHSKNNNKNPA